MFFKYLKGEIIKFWDFDSDKVRLGVVIQAESLRGYDEEDITILKMTSGKTKRKGWTSFEHTYEIQNKESANLMLVDEYKEELHSYVRCGKITTIKKTDIRATVGRVDEIEYKNIIELLKDYLQLDSYD